MEMLDGFYVIHSWRAEAGDLSVRLVPDHFEEGFIDPVVVVTVTGVQDQRGCEAILLRLKSEWIVSLEVTESVADIYAEYDDKPTSLRGRTVSVARSPYSVDELRNVIRQKNEELSQCQEQLRLYRSTIDRTESFVSELLHRAEVKRGLTSRDPASLGLQAELLKRVLQKIQER